MLSKVRYANGTGAGSDATGQFLRNSATSPAPHRRFSLRGGATVLLSPLAHHEDRTTQCHRPLLERGTGLV